MWIYLSLLLRWQEAQILERAKVAALFHDYAQFIDNCPHSQHAKLSSLHAYKYLKECGLFKTTEIDDITYAIRQHSKKSLLTHHYVKP